jgi:hypothetical protein
MKAFVERDGREFELPRGHTLDLYHGRVIYAALDCPGAGGSIFTVRDIEDRDGDTVVHLGDEMGRSGPAAFGGVVPQPTGYPFPD